MSIFLFIAIFRFIFPQSMVTRINLLFAQDNLVFKQKSFVVSQIFQCKSVGLVREECPKRKGFTHTPNTWFRNKCTQPLRNYYK